MQQLTENDRVLLLALRNGKSNKTIASEKCVALQTIKNELTALYEKIGAVNRTQAAIFAERLVNRVISEE